MKNLSSRQFELMAQVIEYIYQNAQQQPDLQDIANYTCLSPGYIQRQFQQWVGISPKKFVQYISLQEAKRCLAEHQTVLETAYQTGLSGTGRLHDLFIQLEGMTPGQYKAQGEGVTLYYSVHLSPFGEVLILSTLSHILAVQFIDYPEQAVREVKMTFPKALLQLQALPLHEQVIAWLQQDLVNYLDHQIPLSLKATPFQLKVWEALLTIPEGQLRSYQDIARQIGKPTAIRAVATAIGQNPIACLIPCHRVIRATGVIGEYHWKQGRKLALLAWEQMRQEQQR